MRLEPSDFLVRRAVALFESDPSRRFRVEDVAETLRVSRAELGRRFRRDLGMPPGRVLSHIRLTLAATLLETDEKIANVARSVGYESEFAFSRAFRRHFGECPSRFRLSPQRERPTLAA